MNDLKGSTVPPRRSRYGISPQLRLSRYISSHAKEWVRDWLERVRQDETTSHYRTYGGTNELLRDTEALYQYLAIWLRHGEWDPRIDPHYRRIGAARRKEGFPLSQVIAAILLAKQTLWDGIVADKQLSVALELEVTRAISRFYDRAIYNTVVGYEEVGG